ncbi:phosphoribosylglycinamide formyltransferase [Metschnikowia bicuspidata var. bicuspidata NRRL YB-4993]|uniref:Phosphoribosylglycinamide formyltransferase n=1 Tax=Metschnikowia bicuspidata var. bicuspidata NRRL YB-4993 TaxID=869754 RepID=A0A1A0H7P0_9ASCO|nr:phosphoribosylglycinamide formyltransferase [Metschnikowia bicuspidata var. bicuspidata NRRL YB-4993]OBA20041.1 phosphoribosylglycinamide formyltransferase [Metschnikowia bicuspidata var. bicuspidata NRRL YB-4993]
MEITVLISGSGSNLQALLEAQKNSLLKGKITQVISSSEDAYGLQRAAKFSVPSKTHVLKKYYKGTTKDDKEVRREKREQFNKDLANLLIHGNIEGTKDSTYSKPGLIVCAGWMLILSPSVLTPLAKAGISIINLHPALPGAFEGTHAIDRAWKAGQDGEITKGGVMIHKVIAEVDRGEPVLVKELDFIKGETLEEYEGRVHKVEHEAIVEGTNIVLEELSADELVEKCEKLLVGK